MTKYKFNTISNSVKSKEYYNLEAAMSDAERTCLEKQEDVQLWEMPGNQFKPNALVFVYWRLLKTYVYKQLKISTEVNDTMGEDEEMKNDKIALCRMFSGEYWKNPNNIGYESINVFLPDGEEEKECPISYMYLPASGDYDIKKINIKYVLLTQHIAKKLKLTGNKKKNKNGKEVDEKNTKTIVRVIGIAEVEDETLKSDYQVVSQDYTCKHYKCIEGGTEFDEMQKIYAKDEKSSLLYKKAGVLANIHKKQSERAKTIEYSRKPLEDIFNKNTSFGDLNILTTLTVKGLSFPKQNIYLTNDADLFSSFILENDKVIQIDSNVSSQKQTTYIDFSKEFIEKILSFGEWEKAGTLDIAKFDKEFESSFLTLIGKENDEISYSNLFAHFLSYQDFCEKFFAYLGMKNVILKKVDREEANIDILVKSNGKTIVIENKVKSALNGHSEEDVNGEEFRDQLKRYYEYVECEYKNGKYFIFAPNYNPINKENWGGCMVNGKLINMKDVWEVVRYDKILDFCDGYHGFDGSNEEWNFNEFKKALKVHTVESLQNYYREMQIRMRKLFN